MEPIATLKLMILTLTMILNQPNEPTVPTMPDCDKLRSQSESVCLACNLYYEARSETRDGMIAVANVTRNRVDSDRFPDNFCAVVWQRKQFSWTKDGQSDKIRNINSWTESYIIADKMVSNYRTGIMLYNDNTNGSLWYHADYISPNWSNKISPETKIGRHVFYTKVAVK